MYKTEFLVLYIYILFTLFSLNVKAAVIPEKADAFAFYDKTMCVVHGRDIDFVDWSDIIHPKKISSFRLKSEERKDQHIDDVALMKDYAFVAIENIGIAVIDVRDPKRPKEVNLVCIDYSQGSSRREYCQQSLRIQKGLLFICSHDLNRLYFTMFLLDVKDPAHPKVVDLYNDAHYADAFVAYHDCERYIKYADLDVNFPGYYIFRQGGPGAKGFELVICGSSSASQEKIAIDVAKVRRETNESPVTRAQDEIAIISYGNRLWIIDLLHAKVQKIKDFNFSVRVIAFNGQTALISNDESEDEYLLLDVKNPDACKSWRYKPAAGMSSRRVIATFFLMTKRNLFVSNESGGDFDLECFNISDIGSIKQVDIPFASWGDEMKWFLKSDDLIIGCGRDIDRDAGFLTIADCRDADHPKIRGTIKGVFAGPKGIYVNANRLYLLDTGDPSISDNWQPCRGIPKVFDISNLDHPVLRSTYKIE